MGRTGSVRAISECVFAVLLQEALNGLDAGAARGTDQGNRTAQLLRQSQRIHDAAARLHQVRHIQQHHRGQAEGEDRPGQHELAAQVEGIEHDEDGVWTRRARHLALEHIDGNARIFGVAGKAVDAGQIDQRKVVAADAAHAARALLYCHAGIVGHLLSQSSEPVEECGFAAVGRSDERDGAKAATRLASLERRLLDDSDGRRRRVTAHH